MRHEEYMRRAIELSRSRMYDGGGGPFAAIVVKDGEIIGEGCNRVIGENDPTAHAEIVAIREACRRVDAFSLEDAVIYTTCEPCPMCLAAIYWARITRIYYANTQQDASRAGFDDELIYAELAKPMATRAVPAERILADEALEVFAEWERWPGKTPY